MVRLSGPFVSPCAHCELVPPETSEKDRQQQILWADHMTTKCDSCCIRVSVMIVIITIQSVTLYFAKFETRSVIKKINYIFVTD